MSQLTALPANHPKNAGMERPSHLSCSSTHSSWFHSSVFRSVYNGYFWTVRYCTFLLLPVSLNDVDALESVSLTTEGRLGEKSSSECGKNMSWRILLQVE